jgi:outer membrane protein assembly factor BamE (lipoprotein component of BamABCDE complex)
MAQTLTDAQYHYNSMNKKYLLSTVASLVLLFAFGCQPSVKFDSAKWKQDNGVENPERNLMADDLVNSHKLIGMSREQMLTLLGKPSPIVDTKDTYYKLSEKYEGIDLVLQSNLIITFGKDSVINKAIVKVWHKY